MQPLVSIIVLNWNGRQFLKPCLDSLRHQQFTRFELLLVDNGSHDGSVEFIKQEYAGWLADGQLRLLELATNTGFSGGNLAGYAQANPVNPYIATLNNDTEAEPDWLLNLVNALENCPAGEKWGAVTGPMTFASDPTVIASAGIEIRQDGVALDRLVGASLEEHQLPVEIFGPCAGAALYRREALAEVGFFDPAFFAYLEDADLAWRLRLAGWRTLYVPSAVVRHAYSGTGKQGSPFKSFQLGRNRIWAIMKNMPARLLWRNLPRIMFYDLSASLYTLIGQRNIHSLRGRLAALLPGHLSRVLKQRRSIQTDRKISDPELARWLVPAPSPFSELKTRRKVDQLALAGGKGNG